jgi:hypothetical protein
MDYIADVIGAFARKGIRFWSENGQLHYKAPKGALTPEEIDEIRLYKDQIISVLARAAAVETAETGPEPRPRLDRAPLTFTQLARWNSHQLSTCHSSYFIPSALRLRGPLNIIALRKSVAELVRRHDALRTQISNCDGVPVQEIAAPGNFEMKVDDLTTLTESACEVEVERLIEKHKFGPIDLAVDPLFRAQLLIIRESEHVLLLSMHHIISDGFSLKILLDELFTAYAQITKGGEFSLPAIPLQFADYAVWQRSTHKSWLGRHASYWDERLKGCQRLRFPSDKNVPVETQLGWRAVPFRMGKTLKAELQEWCRLERTTLVMSVFTAYVALVFRWCNTSESVFLYEIDGRVSQTIRGTIGYFAFPLCLRIRILEGDRFADLLNRVTDEYCRAYEHADFSYMEAQVPSPEFTRNTIFNWAGQDFKTDLVDLGQDSIELSTIPIEWSRILSEEIMVNGPEIDTEPNVMIFENDHEIRGWVAFPLRRFSVKRMERFARNIPVFVKALLRKPSQRVMDVPLLEIAGGTC